MILKKIFLEHHKKLTVFQSAHEKQGFISLFSDMIGEFKRNTLVPEDIRIKDPEASTLLKKKMDDIALIYKEFIKYTEEKYIDDNDKFSIVVDLIKDSKLLANSRIWIDGFFGFTGQEYKIIEKLLGKVNEITVLLTDDDSKPNDSIVFSASGETLKSLMDVAKNAGVKQQVVEFSREIENKSIRHIERELYSYPYNKFEGENDGFELMCAENTMWEVEAVAAKIVKITTEKGYRWHDFAVVTGDMDVYSGNIKRVFSRYNIPFFQDERKSIFSNIVVKYITSLLNIISKNLRYDDVFKLIKTGFVNITKEEYEVLEIYVIKNGIRGKRWFKEYFSDNRRVTNDEETLEYYELLEEIRKKCIAPIERFESQTPDHASITEYTKWLYNFLIEEEIGNKVDDITDELKERKEYEQVYQMMQTWNIVVNVFDQLVEIAGFDVVSLKNFTEILETGFKEFELGVIPPNFDNVLVGNLERSKSHDIKCLFILGLNDGIIPRFGDGTSVLTDDEKIQLRESGFNIKSDSETLNQNETFAIYQAFSKPTDFLCASYSASGNDGKALRPSILVDKLIKIFPELEVKYVTSNNPPLDVTISNPHGTFNFAVEKLKEYVKSEEISQEWLSILNFYANDDKWKDKMTLALRGVYHKNQVSSIGRNNAKELYNTPLVSSVSRFEKYIACPFSHFIRYGLKPKEVREYAVELPEIGNIFHKSIEEFAKKVFSEKIDTHEMSEERIGNVMEVIIDNLVTNNENSVFNSSHKNKYLINRMKRIGTRAAKTVVHHINRGRFLPSAYEVGFSDRDENSAPPIVLELANGEKIYLEGRIDRVDIYENAGKGYAKIIDYKSGSKKFDFAEVYSGLQLQLMVYMEAVVSNSRYFIKGHELSPAGLFYFRIDDPMISVENINSVQIEDEIMAKLKLDGVVIGDSFVAESIDERIGEDGKSDIIPFSLKKDGTPSKTSSYLEEEEYKLLTGHVDQLMKEIAGEILDGKIKIEPFKMGNSIGCAYCDYSGICQFDKCFDDNEYNNIKKYKKDEIFEKLKEKEVDEDG
jgi:ATP-dependent helicase/nuclease subunit B